MDTTKKGWLSEYLKFRNKNKSAIYSEKLKLSAKDFFDKEKFMYKYFQPTGLMYGYPTDIPGVNDDLFKEEWTQSSRMKIILLESMLDCGLLHNDQAVSDEASLDQLTDELIVKIGEYYHQFYFCC